MIYEQSNVSVDKNCSIAIVSTQCLIMKFLLNVLSVKNILLNNRRGKLHEKFNSSPSSVMTSAF